MKLNNGGVSLQTLPEQIKFAKENDINDSRIIYDSKWADLVIDDENISFVREYFSYPGVYVLVLKDTVTYVGESKNVGKRLRSHFKSCLKWDNKLDFDEPPLIWIKRVENHSERLELERRLIRYCQPTLNILPCNFKIKTFPWR